jgi:hypothetical protein
MNQTRPKPIATVSEIVELLLYIDELQQVTDGVTHWLMFLHGPEEILLKPVCSPARTSTAEQDDDSAVLLTPQELLRALEVPTKG